MERCWFTVSSFVSIQGVETPEVGVVVSCAKIVESKVGVEAFSGVEISVGGVAGAVDQGAEGVVVEGVGDFAGIVGKRANAP